MEFKFEKRNIQTNVQNAKKIKMKSNAKAFRIVFSTMYPNIIRAIVREIFTNAWDSQKNAGTLDIPIDIHSPTSYEPWFSIRDYGTGMTPQVIDDIYSNVFESTKDTSNDEAGYMGMGSKTPLGYADSFILVSYVDKVMRAYTIFLDGDGEPVITLQGEMPTKEPNGVLIQLPVKNDDMPEFVQQITHFMVTPKINVNINGKKYQEVMKITHEDKNWVIVEHPSVSCMHVRMGCVLYKLDAEDVLREGSTHYYHRNSSYVHEFLRTPSIIDFDIGDFDVTSSREDIIYNKDSRTKILDRIDEIAQSYYDKFKARIDECKNIFQAGRFLQETPPPSGIVKYATSKNKNIYEYRGMDLNLNRRLIIPKEYSINDSVGRRGGYYGNDGLFNTRKFTNDKYSNHYRLISTGYRKNTKIVGVFVPTEVKNFGKRLNKLYDYVKDTFGTDHKLILVKGPSRTSRTFLKISLCLQFDCVFDIEHVAFTPDKVVRQKVEHIETRFVIQNDKRIQTKVSVFDDPDWTNKVYVSVNRSTYEVQPDIVSEICKILNLDRVAIIMKSQEGLIKKHDLINVVDLFIDHMTKNPLTTEELTRLYSGSRYDSGVELALRVISKDVDQNNIRENLNTIVHILMYSGSKKIDGLFRTYMDQTSKIEEQVQEVMKHDLFQIVEPHKIFYNEEERLGKFIEMYEKLKGE